MATYEKFQQFPEDLAHGVHNFAVGQHTLKLALCSAANAPVATNSIRGNLTEINYANLSGGANPTVSKDSSGQTTGTYALVLDDHTLLASGGSVAGFRYVVVYNDTPTSPADPLIGFFDYGSDLVLADGESLVIDFQANAGTTGNLLTIA